MSEENSSVKEPTLEEVIVMFKTVDAVLNMMIERELQIPDVMKICSSVVVKYFQLLDDVNDLDDDPELREQLIQYYENTVDATLEFLRKGTLPTDPMGLINGHQKKATDLN